MMLNDYWEFNVMGVYDYRSYGSLYDWYEIIQSNISNVDGDLVEAGVFKGRSFLATSLLIKEMKMKKLIDRNVVNYGFDSFTGFPSGNSPQDKWENFEFQYKKG